MVPFAGFGMPVQYAGLKEEHHAVRDHVGMFDVSHMGEFFVSGPDALALVQWVSSNDATALFDGKVQYSCMPNGRGGIVGARDRRDGRQECQAPHPLGRPAACNYFVDSRRAGWRRAAAYSMLKNFG